MTGLSFINVIYDCRLPLQLLPGCPGLRFDGRMRRLRCARKSPWRDKPHGSPSGWFGAVLVLRFEGIHVALICLAPRAALSSDLFGLAGAGVVEDGLDDQIEPLGFLRLPGLFEVRVGAAFLRRWR